ncbi:hypothetical protein [Zhongshania sp.]|uniref:hypothetical protein n=1 Tax=Zhongshania sp. TaxID=1971902 RepID=UPI00356B4251
MAPTLAMIFSSIDERVGDDPAVDKAVDVFYEKVVADDRIAGYFDNLDMFALANTQV